MCSSNLYEYLSCFFFNFKSSSLINLFINDGKKKFINLFIFLVMFIRFLFDTVRI
jgi:hypothetical protein